jgi:hypothetical protein
MVTLSRFIFRFHACASRCNCGSDGILLQTVTEHIHPPYVVQPGPVISPLPGPADERFVEIYPNEPKRVNWPTKPFTDDGPTGILAVRDRWHRGEKVSQIKNA